MFPRQEWYFMKDYRVSEIPCRILGRTNGVKDPLTLFWTASGLRVRVKASCLSVTVRADYRDYEPWIDILIDGVRSQRRSLERGEQSISIFRGCDPQVEREVMILRDTQAMCGDERMLVQIEGLSLSEDGELLPVEEPKLYMRLSARCSLAMLPQGAWLILQLWA